MGKRGVKTKLKDEAAEYFSISSIHGTAYFFSNLNIIERLFWVVVVIIMMVFSFMLINTALVQWNQNPTVTNTDSIDSPITAIQFPTITLCTDFTPDRHGFVRNLLNTYRFQCNTDDECAANQPTRDIDGVPFDLLFVMLPANPNIIDGDMLALVDQFLKFSNTTSFENSIAIGLSQDLITSSIAQKCLDDGHQSIDDIKSFLHKKLLLQADNYGIFTYLNLTGTMRDCRLVDPVNDSPCERFDVFPIGDFVYPLSNEMQCSADELRSLAITTYLVLAMPHPGLVGTYAFNFYFDPSLSQPSTWMYILGPDQILASETGLFRHILLGMFGADNLSLSLTEIAAILYPEPTYLANQKYPRQFPITANLLAERNRFQEDVVATYNIPEFFSIPNYLGTMIGPYWQQAMEVMFHCQLRVRPIHRSRFLRVMDIYQGLEKFQEYMVYDVDLVNEPFYPKWSDYMAYDKMPYRWLRIPRVSAYTHTVAGSAWLNDALQFENDPAARFSGWYNGSTGPEFDAIIDQLRARYQYQNILTICNGPGENRTCDGKLQPTLTDNGICYAFNALNFSSTFISNNTYINMFKHIYEPDDNSSDLILNENNGQAFQLYILLDSHQSKIADMVGGTFSVAINQILGFMNVRDNAVAVELGYITKITISVTQYTTTDAFSKLDMNERDCRYVHEKSDPQSLYNFYSYEACTFECRLRYSAQECGCTPLNYPQYGTNITEICDAIQSYCFDSKMNDKVNDSDCTCLPNCVDVIFTVKTDKYKMSYEKECNIRSDYPWGMSQKANDLSLVIAEKIRHMDGEEYMYWYNRMVNNVSDTESDLLATRFVRYVDPRLTQAECRTLLENDFALLTIEVSAPTMTVLQRDIAIDFPTKISNIGGTLGLFTGMSILSFFEIAFFLYKFTSAPFRPNKEIPAVKK